MRPETAFPKDPSFTKRVHRQSDFLKIANPPPIRIIASYPELAKLTETPNPRLPKPLAELRPFNAIRAGPIWGRAVAIAAFKIAGQNAHLWAHSTARQPFGPPLEAGCANVHNYQRNVVQSVPLCICDR